ncbi:hypothetical protein [Streptomyces himalayensis]|uniref:Uncharacterized protein n=1 Tax=Streptomyces himalayensis subsp. himalayensis TaxID=2756131 RepID=A0A7W0DU82_9ACTN|nr:hypothetical protein [Streptomyces himalayensis]MBA2950833.1 hypothetical protein [Streptomyces himalayensis subsp. himalayensis]
MATTSPGVARVPMGGGGREGTQEKWHVHEARLGEWRTYGPAAWTGTAETPAWAAGKALLLPGSGATSVVWFADVGTWPAHRGYAVDLMGEIGRSVRLPPAAHYRTIR